MKFMVRDDRKDDALYPGATFPLTLLVTPLPGAELFKRARTHTRAHLLSLTHTCSFVSCHVELIFWTGNDLPNKVSVSFPPF